MKKILFPVFQGVVSRNILRTNFLRIVLKRPDIMFIFLVNSQEKKEYLNKEFNHPRIIFEIAPKYLPPKFNGIFRFLKQNLLKTRRMDIRRRIYLEETKNYFVYAFKYLFNRLFARKIFRQLTRMLDYLILKDKNYLDIFDRFKPDLLISAHPFSDEEVSLLKQAKRLRVKSLGIINSWDKITSRSILRVLPNKMVVHNDIIKKEVIKHADMSEENISIVGIPHYDLFFRGKPRDKNNLYSRFNIDIKKKIILFCPTGQFYSDNDVKIINTLIKINQGGYLGKNVQLMVRFPPNDVINTTDILEKDKVVFYQPGIRFSSKRGVDWDMDDEDDQLLFDMLYWSSVVICPPSSLSIDSAVIDRPIINIKFSETNRYSNDNVNLYYDSDHYSHILKCDGISIATSESELINIINKYIVDPSLNRTGRKTIVKEQCWSIDGKSAERLAQNVLNIIQNE